MENANKIMGLNTRIKKLVDTGIVDLHGATKTTKAGEIISIMKRFYPYINSNGVFLTYRRVYRANGDCYLRFFQNTNITNLQITNCIAAQRNSETRSRNKRIKKQMILYDEFYAVNFTPLEADIIDTLKFEYENDLLYSYNPTPEAMVEHYKEKMRQVSEKYDEAVKTLNKKRNDNRP